MAGENTEKPMTKAEQKKTIVPTKEKQKNKPIAPIKKPEEKKEVKSEVKPEEKKQTKKPETKKVKKTSATINVSGVQISTKYSIAICKFINKKTIPQAIKDLEQVMILKKPVPMKGEIPHRKGKIMSGRFPIRASKHFITLLKSLQSNATQHDLEEPIITQAIANKGQTVYGRGGRTQKKRTNLRIVCTEKRLIKKKKENKK